MRKVFAFFSLTLFMFICAPLLAGSVDEAEAKKRGVPVEVVLLENEKAVNADLQKQLDLVKSQLANAAKEAANLNAAIKILQAENTAIKEQLAAATSKLEAMSPSNAIASEDGTISVSIKQIATLGEKYEGKVVKLVGVTYWGADVDHVDILPSVEIASNGLVSTINTKEFKKWIGFSVIDGDKNIFSYGFADKEIYGETLAAMKDGQKLNLKGTIIQTTLPGTYALICTKIDIIKESPAIEPPK